MNDKLMLVAYHVPLPPPCSHRKATARSEEKQMLKLSLGVFRDSCALHAYCTRIAHAS